MITSKKITQLCLEAQGKIEIKEKYSELKPVKLEPISEARVLALAEVLHISPESLIQVIVTAALGDAHNGFLSAYTELDERLKSDIRLKSRVKEILATTNNVA